MDLDREEIGDEGQEDEEEEGFQFIYAQGDLCYYKHKMVTELDGKCTYLYVYVYI
jgi:hypothetical protein